MADHSPHQKRIIRRYYNNIDGILCQRLSELTTEIYLAEGKKADSLWKRAEKALAKAGLPQQRIEHLLERRDPKLLAQVVKELTAS
ncbi:hypothetical protein Pan216_16910 [Planctomycetes bacterium Pan216]|uniref:Uncharacterized protein n=1 Tax=Kolteria novifilia TaxID=2527975 RepID=A0A518B1H7_9BACT|nr:hypothetical protein Pan216_16910 [Planctomycetes bacterium Pan216]